MKIYLIGAGMGNLNTMTAEAKKAIESSRVIVGSKRMISGFEGGKKTKVAYKPDEIRDVIESVDEDETEVIAVLFSGDIGFYSGARCVIDEIKDYNFEIIPGISSMQYFAAKLAVGWEDWVNITLHGRQNSIVTQVRQSEKVFSLLADGEQVNEICNKLIYYGLCDVDVYIGENLSSKNEKIYIGKPKEFVSKSFGNLVVMLIENKNCVKSFAIKDSEFIRGNVPMTKEDIRHLSILKLELEKDACVYDIGSGTGSVAVEVSFYVPYGKVIAIEKSADALEMIEKNKCKFAADNVDIVLGKAPYIFEGLPIPTHAFIGGSSGELEEIIIKLLELNKNIKIVINTVTLNTLSDAYKIIKKYELEADITQLNISKGEYVGDSIIMKANNPVYIIKLG